MVRLLIWIVVGLAVGAAIGGAIALVGDLDSMKTLGLVAIAGAAIGFVLGALSLHRSAYLIEEWVPVAAAHVRGMAIHSFGRQPWSTARYDRRELRVWRELGPRPVVIVPAILLGVLPALLVLLFDHGRQTLTIRAEPESNGSIVSIRIQPRGNDGRLIANRFLNQTIASGGLAETPPNPPRSGSRPVNLESPPAPLPPVDHDS